MLQVLINYGIELLQTHLIYMTLYNKQKRGLFGLGFFKEQQYRQIIMPKYIHFQIVLIPQNICNSFKYKSEKTELKKHDILTYPCVVIKQGIL